MATVRIYKIAEVLGTSSQEVMDRLRREHGIEVKSASSTIEEVVARQFVERVARERGLAIAIKPSMFADTAPAKAKGGKGTRPAEAPKPTTAPLPPPRLVKTPKPPAPPPVSPPAETDAPAPVAVPAAVTTAPPPVAAAPATAAAPGRVVPPTLRLRIEEEEERAGAATAAPPAAPPAVVAPAPTVTAAGTAPAVAPPAPASPPAAASAAPVPSQPTAAPVAPVATRPTAPQTAPRPVAPPPPRPAVPAPPRLPIGGPRPLPTPPVRPTPPATRPAAPPRPTPPPRPLAPRPVSPRPAAPREPRPAPTPVTAPPPITRHITLAEGMTVKDLAEKLGVKAKDVLKKLLDRRLMLTINSTLDAETAAAIAREFGAEVQFRSFEEEMLEVEAPSAPEDLVPRAPVVTVMGHVDHGKTTLLDAIRETRVAEREAGGITQHIGAYAAEVGGRKVVFLDTPGHEAFTMMRARGARVTDVVVLVVAADDGVMPQTREAIDHARAAGVPIVVAINKIDKPEANPERVKKELADLGLVPEEWGGQTVMVEVSAKKRQNLDLLLEMILLVAELSELKANPTRSALGTVLEAKLDRGRGPVATVLVQDGTLRVGDTVLVGTLVGKVRALIDDRGRPLKEAGPATPVEVLGLPGVPQPGDALQAIADPAKARQIALFRQAQAKEKALGTPTPRLTLESLQRQIAEGAVKELPLVIKADVQGSAEVLADTLGKLGDERVRVRVVHSGVGAISESDVLLASASNAIIVGFNVRPDRNAAELAEREKVDIRLHSVIYEVVDEIKKALAGLLEPTLKEVHLGTAEVRQIFKIPKVGTVAGCMVTDGRVTRGGETQVRLLRDNVVIYEGRIASLRRFKDDVSEVRAGFECGIALERFNDIKPGDVIEVFTVERVAAAV